jgi:hypothetical protein
MKKLMNEICKAIGVAVISIIAILIIIRTLSWQQSIIKRVMVTREGLGGFGDSDSDSDSDSECEFNGTRNKLVKLMKLQKKNKKAGISDNIVDGIESNYYSKYYDSSDEEWDTGSEGEGDLEKVCDFHKKQSLKEKQQKKKQRLREKQQKARKDAEDIRTSNDSGNSMPSSGGGMFG